MAAAVLGAAHRRRLRDMWRSAGWPCKDLIELDLLAAGLLLRQWDAQGRETLLVSDAGLQLLAASRRLHQAALTAHEALVERVACVMRRDGRIVWRRLSLRAPCTAPDGSTRWQMAMPDVFSIRHTTLADAVEPVVHEIKVSRADLLSDLRRPDKMRAYLVLSSQCWYVLRAGIGSACDVPAECGVMEAGVAGLQVLRPAPRRPHALSVASWMALARACPEPALDGAEQAWLGDPAAAGPGHGADRTGG